MSTKDQNQDDPMYREMFNIPPADQEISWGPIRSFIYCTAASLLVAAVLDGIHTILN